MKMVSSTHSYSLRPRTQKLHLLRTRLVSGEKSLQFRGEKLWMSIPDEIKNNTSYMVFKREMKMRLFDS